MIRLVKMLTMIKKICWIFSGTLLANQKFNTALWESTKCLRDESGIRNSMVRVLKLIIIVYFYFADLQNLECLK